MNYSTADVAKMLVVTSTEILKIKSRHKQKLRENVHWVRKPHPHGGDGLWWTPEGVDQLQKLHIELAVKRQRRVAGVARPSDIPDTDYYKATDELRQESDLLKRLADLKKSGTNKTQCIFTLWGIKKGGSKRYQYASRLYDDLTEELKIQEEDSNYRFSAMSLLSHKLNDCEKKLVQMEEENKQLRQALLSDKRKINELITGKAKVIAALEKILSHLNSE